MIKKYGLTLLFLPLLVFLFMVFARMVYADTFYDSGGDIEQCAVSLAVGLYYDYPSGITFNANDLEGDGGMAPFHALATDLFPNAQRFSSQAVHVSVPPLTKMHVYGVFKNDNPYIIHMPAGGVLFTSFTNPQDSNIGRLMSDTTSIVPESTHVVFAGSTDTRSGNGITLGQLGDIAGNSENKIVLDTFTTIQPIHVARQVNYNFDAHGNLVLQIVTTIQNVSDYQENNIHVSDIVDPFYHEDVTISLVPHEIRVLTYGGNIGTVYAASIVLPGVSVQDPNSHTEILQAGETSYEQNPNATSVIFPRSDENAPLGWTGNQSSLPILDQDGQIDITLIPYSVSSSSVTITVHPNVVVQKLQNGTTDDISLHVGDRVTYTLLVQNTGNAPATDTFIDDHIVSGINIIDAGGATACLYTDIIVNNYVCHDALLWNIPLIPAGQTVTLTFTAVVANTAFQSKEVLNYIDGRYNENNSVFSNVTTLVVLPFDAIHVPIIPITIFLSSYASLDTGSILGVVWHDINRDGIYESSEDPIAGASVELSFHQGDMDVTQSYETNPQGYYEVDQLPFAIPIQAHIIKPEGYAYESTYDTYTVMLTDAGEASIAVVNNRVNISAPFYTNQVSLGVYNARLAETGEDILPIILSIAGCMVLWLLVFCCRKHIPNQHI